ncbi:hypothetical protein BCR34DRAFT_587615 [Clohesyomyces aquaticus]|uniref:Uncharacterized protein n=1 Tax=Clohesyomyces aquaticus TaxID=1231657 RepID=A0A1Y1ZNV8_9PLEO|nr:hypothetical protein BCR34DRAFT_587615 [Clohesyomyces aquaticus]
MNSKTPAHNVAHTRASNLSNMTRTAPVVSHNLSPTPLGPVSASSQKGQGSVENPLRHGQGTAPENSVTALETQRLTPANLLVLNEAYNDQTIEVGNASYNSGANGDGNEPNQRARVREACRQMGIDVPACCLPGGHEGKMPMEYWIDSSSDTAAGFGLGTVYYGEGRVNADLGSRYRRGFRRGTSSRSRLDEMNTVVASQLQKTASVPVSLP